MYRTTGVGAWFEPLRLPPALWIPPHVQRAIEDATHELGQVEMCRTLLPNASLLIYSSLRLEALASSTIEGTVASPEELIRFEVEKRSQREQVREVGNYTLALEWGSSELGKSAITQELVFGLHSRLLNAVRGGEHAGHYKTVPNRVGPHLPPLPGGSTNKHMEQLLEYINGDNHESRVVQCALTHYQFETIHPFSDGNGRVGRLLILIQMIKLGLLSAPLIYPSVVFEARRREYTDRLQGVRDQQEWSEWILFFAVAISEACQSTINLTMTIIGVQHEIAEGIKEVRRRASMLAVLDVLYRDPVLNVADLSERASLSPNAVRNCLRGLQERGIVEELSGRKRGLVYGCVPILAAIFRATPSQGNGTTEHESPT
jgi:Fic family protein